MLQKTLSHCLLVLSLAGCTTIGDEPFEPVAPIETSQSSGPSVTAGIETYMQQRARVESVGFRLRRAAAPECAIQGNARADLGIVVWSTANFPNAQDRSKLQEVYGLTSAVTVAIATEQGPAHKAGLRRGDVITQVNGDPIREGLGATERFITLSNRAAKQGSVALKLATGSVIEVVPDQVCEHPALLIKSPETNAAADGTTFAITTGLFQNLKSDDELALVLSHELAHNTSGHLREQASNRNAQSPLIDTILRAAPIPRMTGTGGFAPEKERAADYIGLYFMARAGFEISAAEGLWERLSKASSNSPLNASHPTSHERLIALKNAIAEIRAKRSSGKPLNPNQ